MSILVIDDEAALRRSLCDYLEEMDYDTLAAANGMEGLEVLDQNLQSIEAVIVDLNMPVMDGYSFIQETVARTKELPLIVLSGVGIVEDALKAMRLGAWDFITKPLHNFKILDYTLEKVFEKARLIRENRAYQNNLEQLVHERTAELEATRRQVMQRLSRAAEYKDNETGRHVIRVGEISALLAQAVGLPEERCEMLRECAPLHMWARSASPTRSCSSRASSPRPSSGPCRGTACTAARYWGRSPARTRPTNSARTPTRHGAWLTPSSLAFPESWPCFTTSAGTARATPLAWRARQYPWRPGWWPWWTFSTRFPATGPTSRPSRKRSVTRSSAKARARSSTPRWWRPSSAIPGRSGPSASAGGTSSPRNGRQAGLGMPSQKRF